MHHTLFLILFLTASGRASAELRLEPEPRALRLTALGQTFTAPFSRIREVRIPARSFDGEPFFLRATFHRGGPRGRMTGEPRSVLTRTQAVFRWEGSGVPVEKGAVYYLHIERCGGGVFEARLSRTDYKGGTGYADGRTLSASGKGKNESDDFALTISESAQPAKPPLPWAHEGEPAPGTGTVSGDTGGNERDCVLFSRRGGEIRSRHTAPDGLYRFDGVPPGEYMMLSIGRVASRVRIRAGETTTLNWGRLSAYDLGAETWSCARKSFGQTFKARGRSLIGLSFWIPGKPVTLELSLHKGGPRGPLVGKPFRWPRPVSWVVSARWPPGVFPLRPGKFYYIEIRSTDGTAWAMGAVDRGEGQAEGHAYYDGEPVPSCDLAMTLNEDGAGGLFNIAEAREGLGFVKEGPAAGLTEVAGQSFVAVTKTILCAYVNAGWGAELGRVRRFSFQIRETGPGGKPVGRAVTMRMVGDWGATAVWFPGEIKTVPGRVYFLEYRPCDGKPFYAYLARDTYAGGCAYRDGKPLRGFDCVFTLKGENYGAGPPHPYNVRVENVTPNGALLSWEGESEAAAWGAVLTGGGRTRTLYAQSVREGKVKLRLKNLKPLTPYRFVPFGVAKGEERIRVWGREEFFLTAADPSSPGPRYLLGGPVRPPASDRASSSLIRNGGFEDALGGWRRSGAWGSVTTGRDGFRPFRGKAMFGWASCPDPAREKVPRKLDPFRRTLIAQTVRVKRGARYVLSAWILTGERGGGWQRNDRVRLVADPDRGEGLGRPSEVREEFATQWFSTRGEWRRFELSFTARSNEAAVGIQFLQWWLLAADYLYVDEVTLVRL